MKKNKIYIVKILEIIFILLAIISIVMIVKWNIDNKKSNDIKVETSKNVKKNKYYSSSLKENENSSNASKYIVDFKALKKENSDTVAWLKVPNTKIDYAVVKAQNNDYYLNHDFNKKSNSAGWIFAEKINEVNGYDKNLVIYGHNRRDGSMFGSLKNVLKEDWYKVKENRKIYLETPNGENIYEVFSIYTTKAEEYYATTSFSTKGSFEEFIKKIKSRSIYDFNIEVGELDNLLTLSTCSDNNKYRTVLHAKKIK